MNEKKSLEMYDNMPIARAVTLNAIPAVVAMLMTLIYNLADTFLIGQTHDPYQVAAVSLATPVFLIFMSLGTIFGIGGTSVISRAFGENRSDFARHVCSFCMWGSVAVGLAMTAVMLIFLNPILTVIGASIDTWDFTKNYLIIVSCGGTFSVLSSCFSSVLRAEGEAGRAMTGQIIGNGLNIVLDGIAVLVLHQGVVGCAVATLIDQTVGALYYLSFFVFGRWLPSDGGIFSCILNECFECYGCACVPQRNTVRSREIRCRRIIAVIDKCFPNSQDSLRLFAVLFMQNSSVCVII